MEIDEIISIASAVICLILTLITSFVDKRKR